MINKKRRRLWQTIEAGVLSLALSVTSVTAVFAEEPGQLVSSQASEQTESQEAGKDYAGWDTLKVFETTDVHGYISDISSYQEDTFEYRLAYISNVVNQARANKEYKDVILLDGGDIYQGTPHSDMTYGNYLRAAFDAMGYDAVALGNHEFDWDVTKYAADSDGTMASYVTDETGEVNPSIPVLMSNLYYAGTDQRVNFTKDYTVVEKGGYKVAIVGWTDDYTSSIMAKKIAPYKIDGNIESLKKETAEVKKETNADVLIVLAHGSPSEIANQVDPDVVDLVCGGHSHKNYCGTAENGVDYIQGGSNAVGYATAEIKVDPQSKEVDVVNPSYSYNTPKNQYSDMYYENGTNQLLDSNIVKISQDAWNAVKGDMQEVLATVDKGITKDIVEGSIVTSSAGNWLTQLMLDATKDQNTIAAFTNSSGIRTSLALAEGETSRNITSADVYTICPFGNRLLTYAITGKQLATQIENAIRFNDNDELNYSYMKFGDQFSGITVTYEKQGTRIKVLSIVTDDGELIDVNDETKTYNVVVNEYCATVSYTDPKTKEVTDSVFKNLTPVVAQEEAPVDNVSMVKVLREHKETEGLAMQVDTSNRIKEDTGEAAACEKMKDLVNRADQWNAENVTSENKEEIQNLMKEMDELIAGGKLTEKQVSILQGRKENLQTLLDQLDKKGEDQKQTEEVSTPATTVKNEEKKTTDKKGEDKKADSVKTGDANAMMLWLLMMGAGGTGMITAVIRMRRKSNSK